MEQSLMAHHPTTESYRISPGAFSNPAGSDYLGNPQLVTRLVGEFCAKVEATDSAVRNGSLQPAQAKASLYAEVKTLADIFSGRNPAFKTIKGYNEHTLPAKLQADLGQFWREQRTEWADDPVCVLFSWLGALTQEKSRLAQGDDDLLEIMLKPSVQYAVQVLLGIEQRQKPE